MHTPTHDTPDGTPGNTTGAANNDTDEQPLDRPARIIEAREELAQLKEQLADLLEQVNQKRAHIRQMQTLEDAVLIAGRAPSELFTDPQLLTEVAQREWAGSRDAQAADAPTPLTGFITEAFADLDPAIRSWEREVASDWTSVTRLMPKLFLFRRQPVTDLAAVLTRIYPALAVDGILRAEILDHNCDNSWLLEMDGSDTAALVHPRTGKIAAGDRELGAVLERVAKDLWFTPYPD